MQPLGFFALKLLAGLGMRISGTNPNGFLHKYSSKLSGLLTPVFFFKCLRAIQLKFLTAVILNITYITKKPQIITLVNIIVSVIALSLYLVFCLASLFYSYKLEKYFVEKKKRYLKLPPKLKLFFFLKKEIKDEVTGLGRHFSVIFWRKDLVMSAMIVGLFEYSVEAQIFVPIVYNLFVVALLIKYWPLKETKSNFLALFGTLTEIAVLIIFAGLYFSRKSSEEFRYQVLGKLMVVTIFVIFACYIGIGVFFTVKSLRVLLKKETRVRQKAKKNIKRRERRVDEEVVDESNDRQNPQIVSKKIGFWLIKKFLGEKSTPRGSRQEEKERFPTQEEDQG